MPVRFAACHEFDGIFQCSNHNWGEGPETELNGRLGISVLLENFASFCNAENVSDRLPGI